MKARWLIRGVKIAVIAMVALAVFGFILMSLWNWLAPAVFGARTITFWQALGILVLSKILFSGFGRPARPGWALARPNEGSMGADDSRRTRKIPAGHA